ncbi:EmrB/QacA subfamily drug resistance transporter [Kitasatospora sp. MAP12-15]|uniref:DHA2 family efflux MFS transporter permease subunit n=1 Tax=unclassified Kitasatospora TaxID=2633591 RepID=UPI002473125B|nr:DHA2 family efflux MFS transporter permease subunit [Kitasatospora sp. MAP12-44]MDH6110592.1 EmrB/QacA subfamily drug resistance transporter [Kitasatospora sp. MAP12-44]
MTDTADARSRTAAPSAPVAEADSPKWSTLPVVLAPTFMVTLDMFIVNVAIPSIQAKLHAGSGAIQFVVAGISLAVAAVLVMAGRLGDIYGRRRMFTVGLALFTAASALCGVAPNVGELIVGRVAQGISAGMMMPQVLAILSVAFTGANRLKAFNAYGIAMGFAGVFGQLIGGVLIKADVFGLGWRAIFLINVPIGIVVLLLTPRHVPESKGTGSAKLDLVGTALVTVGLVGVIYPLIKGREEGWPAWTWICLAGAAVLLAIFAVYQNSLGNKGGAPLVNMSLFKQRAFSVGLITTLLFYAVMSTFFLIFALYLQQGHGLSALDSGLIFIPLGSGFFVASMMAKQLGAKLGRQTLAVGAVVLAVGLGILELIVNHLGTNGAIGWITPALLVAGYGMGMVMAPLSATVLAGIPPQFAAAASGVLSTAVQVGTALGIAIIGNLFYNALGTHIQRSSFTHAFILSTEVLAVLALAVAASVQLLPKPAKKA